MLHRSGGQKIFEFFGITLVMENKKDNSPIQKVFLISGGLMIIFLLIKYTFNLEVDLIDFFTLESLIKILIGLLFIVSSFLVYKHYNKS